MGVHRVRRTVGTLPTFVSPLSHFSLLPRLLSFLFPCPPWHRRRPKSLLLEEEQGDGVLTDNFGRQKPSDWTDMVSAWAKLHSLCLLPALPSSGLLLLVNPSRLLYLLLASISFLLRAGPKWLALRSGRSNSIRAALPRVVCERAPAAPSPSVPVRPVARSRPDRGRSREMFAQQQTSLPYVSLPEGATRKGNTGVEAATEEKRVTSETYASLELLRAERPVKEWKDSGSLENAGPVLRPNTGLGRAGKERLNDLCSASWGWVGAFLVPRMLALSRLQEADMS